MATITANYNRTKQQPSNGKQNSVLKNIAHWLRVDWSEQSPAILVLGIAGYFLLLGSIAVIYMSNQFPWFMVAPITILLAIVYLRHGDAKHSQREYRQ